MGKRRQAREMAVQMLFQRDLGGEPPLSQLFRDFDVHLYRREASDDGAGELGETFNHARALVEGTVAHLSEIDEILRAQAENWRLERMSAVDRNILRLALYEMMFETEVPKVVVVDEAIELAKKFGSEQSGRFVNGLLDALLKQKRFPGQLK